MLKQEDLFCTEKNITVSALVEIPKAGRGRKGMGQKTAVSCTNTITCESSTFCRFVNPLTSRNPLAIDPPAQAV